MSEPSQFFVEFVVLAEQALESRLWPDGRSRATRFRWRSARRLDREGEFHGRDRAEAAAASAHAADRRGRRGAAARGLERVSRARPPVAEGPAGRSIRPAL